MRHVCASKKKAPMVGGCQACGLGFRCFCPPHPVLVQCNLSTAVCRGSGVVHNLLLHYCFVNLAKDKTFWYLEVFFLGYCIFRNTIIQWPISLLYQHWVLSLKNKSLGCDWWRINSNCCYMFCCSLFDDFSCWSSF